MAKKTISLILSLLLVLQCSVLFVTTGTAENSVYEGDYIISNPYANVDFKSWQAYKTQLHCHTTASDGYLTIKDAISKYYDLDYDIIAITDHGTNNLGWDKAPECIPILRDTRKDRTGGMETPIVPFTEDEYNAYLYGTASTSSPDIVRTHDDGICDVMLGNELNMATPFADCHLTHYWSTYGQGLAGVFGDYETPSRESSKDGGVVMLSHVGEYVYIDKDSYNHVGQKIDDYYVNKFARIFLDNPSSKEGVDGFVSGMGINSATDAHTRCDRILYDQILQKTIPNGVVPWGYTFSDSHNEASMNDAYTMMLIPDWSDLTNEQRNEKLRDCMENGEFFSVSHYSYALELDGEPEWPESYAIHDIDVDAMNMNETPMVIDMSVDEDNDTITVTTENANRIVWVSNGNAIKRETVENGENGNCTFTIDLHDDALLNGVNLYVRFYITGPEGICYSQPMVIHETDSNGKAVEFDPVDVPKTHDISSFLRGLVTVLDWVNFKWSPIVWIFKFFALGYNPLERLISDINIFNF